MINKMPTFAHNRQGLLFSPMQFMRHPFFKATKYKFNKTLYLQARSLYTLSMCYYPIP
jgi:hypothetical protein